MERCERCLMPRSKPGLIWENGVCGGCLHYDKRAEIIWESRREELRKICDKYRSKYNYDCVIPVSGGKDSHWLVRTLITECDMHPILVTVNDNFRHTQAGTHNLKNLINQYELNHYAYTISDGLFRAATRWAFEREGNPLKFIEYAIYSIPYEFAKRNNIPLVFFGEDSAWEYGTSTENRELANNVIWWLMKQLEKELDWWKAGELEEREVYGIYTEVDKTPLVFFMSYFYPWSSLEHLKVAQEIGFQDLSWEWHREGCIEDFEQIDSYGYIAHLWMRYPRHGYQRTTDIVSRRIREGKMTKEEGQTLIDKYDHVLDPKAWDNFCDVLLYDEEDAMNIVRNADWNKYLKGV